MVTSCKVFFNPSGLDHWLALSTIPIWLFHHLVGFFLFSLELSILMDDVCCFDVPRMIFLMYGCCKPLVYLLEKNLV